MGILWSNDKNFMDDDDRMMIDDGGKFKRGWNLHGNDMMMMK